MLKSQFLLQNVIRLYKYLAMHELFNIQNVKFKSFLFFKSHRNNIELRNYLSTTTNNIKTSLRKYNLIKQKRSKMYI